MFESTNAIPPRKITKVETVPKWIPLNVISHITCMHRITRITNFGKKTSLTFMREFYAKLTRTASQRKMDRQLCPEHATSTTAQSHFHCIDGSQCAWQMHQHEIHQRRHERAERTQSNMDF